MPLLDHFHPPLSVERRWESFHTCWAAAIAGALNDGRLPSSYFAEVQVHAGPRVEIDVATFERNGGSTAPGTATAILTAPVLVLPATFPDDLEVQVYEREGGPSLVAAIELVSPRNKDRAAARRAFAVKCASYLIQGAGLAIIDVVTSRKGNMHDEILRMLKLGAAFRWPDSAPLYAASYRPVQREGNDQIDVWAETLTLEEDLPTLPLPIAGYNVIPLDLEATYSEARQQLRLE